MSHPGHSTNLPFPLWRQPGVTDTFAELAWDALGKVYADGIPEAKAVLAKTRWEVAPAPTIEHYRMVGAEPQSGWNLLGLTEPNVPTILLFQADIERQAQNDNLDLFTKTHEVMVHELQHRFGFNHINAEIRAAALLAAPASPCSSCTRATTWGPPWS